MVADKVITAGKMDAMSKNEKGVHAQHYEGGGTLENVLHKHLQGTGLEDRQTALELAMNVDPGPRLISVRVHFC